MSVWGDSVLDRGPIPAFFYARHDSTILHPQYPGRTAWYGLGMLTCANLIVLLMWNPGGFPEGANDDDGDVDEANIMLRSPTWDTWMNQNFTTNLTNAREGRVWTLASASLSHQHLSHFAGNMFALWLFGFPTYRVMGTRAFYGLYFAGGVACSSTHLLHNVATGRVAPPLTHQEISQIQQLHRATNGEHIPASMVQRLETADRRSLGASGSVMAVAGVAACLFPLDRVRPSPVRSNLALPLPSAVVLYVVSDLAGLTEGISNKSQVDHAGHLGGMIMGMIYVTIAWYTRTGSFRFLQRHPIGGQLPLVFRFRQWRQGTNPWQL